MTILQGWAGCTSEKGARRVGPVEDQSNCPAIFFSFHALIDAVSSYIILSMTVIRLLFLICTHVHIQIIFTLQHLFFSFTASSSCQNRYLYLTAVFLSSSMSYITAIALLVLAVFTSFPPLPPTPRAFLSKQFNWSWNGKCLLLHIDSFISHWAVLF